MDLTGFYGAIYSAFAVEADLTLSDDDDPVTIMVNDLTKGVLIPDPANPGVKTLKPVVRVRRIELTDLGIAADDLDDAILDLPDESWVVIAWGPRPRANGEASSEIEIILMKNPHPRSLIISAAPVLTGQVGVAYAGFTVSATGGITPYVFSVASGALPTGISLNSSTGVVSGTPIIAGNFSAVIRVRDARNTTASLASFTIVVTSATLRISGTPVLTGQVGFAYDGFIVSATGGTAPRTFSIIAGSLPSGISLNASTGVVSGTPTEDGTFAGIVIRVTDALSNTADLASFSLVISPAFNVANQTIDFGALTLSGAGGAAPVASVTITSASITSGGDGHWLISSAGVLIRNQAAVPSAQVLTCLFNGSVTAVITINAIANAYSVKTSTELSSLLTGVAEATLSGKKVLYRPGSYAFPNLYGSQLYSSTVTHESHDHNNQAVLNKWTFAGAATSPGNVTLQYLTFYAAWSVGATDPFIDMHSGCSSHDITIDHCTIYTDLQPGRLGGSIGTLSPDTRNFKYAISLNGSCTNIAITNNEIHHMVHGVFVSGTNITIRGNTMHHCWGDFVNISAQFDGTATATVTIEFNDQNNMCPDASLCHPDFCQGFLQGGGTPGNVTDVIVRGNTHWEGYEGEHQYYSGVATDVGDQFMLLQELGSGAKYLRWTIDGNCASLTAQAGISVEERIETATIKNNTLGRNWPSTQDAAHGFGSFPYAAIIISDGDTNVAVTKNTGEQVSVTGGGTNSGNVTSLSRTSISTYHAAFVGTTFNPMTRAELLAQFLFLLGGSCDLDSSGGAWTSADAGALGSSTANGYYNFDTGALN